MDCNPELEEAEAELQERFRREREEAKTRPRATWTDHAISFAAVIHFVAAVVWIVVFMIAPFAARTSRHDSFWVPVWVCSFPAAIGSLGVGLALIRVLDMTTGATRRQPPVVNGSSQT